MAAEVLNLKLASSATVSYGDAFGSEDFKLLEVDERILKELLQDGLTIKGGPDDEAVLCTSAATYAIKYVSTSNTVLLIPPSEKITNGNNDDGMGFTMAQVVATSSGHLELVETAPQLDNLKTLLNQRPYVEDLEGGQMQEDEPLEGLYSWDDLTTMVQASDRQLKEALKALNAVQIGDYWRVVDERFMQGLLEVIFLSAVQHDWDLKCLQEAAVVQALKDDCYSPQIVRHCLSCYGKKGSTLLNDCKTSHVIGFTLNEENGIKECSQLWELDDTKVCLHYAKLLLRDSAKWKLEEFMKEWRRTTPAGMEPSIEMLRGEALVEKLGPESWLQLYSISSLPTKPADRFSALFKERAKWEWDDLEPYLRDMQTPGQSVEAMLLKYTRKTQPTASSAAIYTAR
jgi:sister chromatid cohesion protein DCC1